MTSDRLGGRLVCVGGLFGHSVKWAMMCSGRRDSAASGYFDAKRLEGQGSTRTLGHG